VKTKSSPFIFWGWRLLNPPFPAQNLAERNKIKKRSRKLLTEKEGGCMLVKRRKQVGKIKDLKGLRGAKFAAKEPRKKNSLKDKNEA
jgi:hypothetical protein